MMMRFYAILVQDCKIPEVSVLFLTPLSNGIILSIPEVPCAEMCCS